MRGIGDDCAVVRPGPGLDLSVTTDMLLEGRHFLPGANPRALGHKSLAVNLSDLAASGATPRWFTLAIGLVKPDEGWLAEFSAGLFTLADRFGVDLIGGDTTRSPIVTVSITALGEVAAGKSLSRAGAQPGDDLWVSGEIGGAALALIHPEIAAAAKRLHEPEPRVELGKRLIGLANAAIDVSDGLASDIGHVLERSGVGAEIQYERVPKAAAFGELRNDELEKNCVLSGGDDYELVFAAAPDFRGKIESLASELRIPLTRIGAIVKGKAALSVLDAAGRPMAWRPGYDHFAPAT